MKDKELKKAADGILQDAILVGMQIAYEICQEHIRGWDHKAQMPTHGDAVRHVAAEILQAMQNPNIIPPAFHSADA